MILWFAEESGGRFIYVATEKDENVRQASELASKAFNAGRKAWECSDDNVVSIKRVGLVYCNCG